jgi:hypothetical protein
MIHVMSVARLGGPSVAAAVVRYDTIAVIEEEQQLRVPVIGRKRLAMAEHNGLTFAPVFVIDLRTILRRDRIHLLVSLNICW